MDDLINEWKKFSLKGSEKEAVIKIETKMVEEIKDQVNHCLIGKLLSNRLITISAIKKAMNGAWKTRKKFEVEFAGKNVYAFKFQSQEDRDWVLNNGPWLFDKSLVILEEPKVDQRISELKFNKMTFWLRLINLPVGFQNRYAAELIGNKIGEFIEVDYDKDRLHWGDTMRIRVRIDISNPLPRGFMLKAEGIEGDCWVTIRYERLPEFCFHCGCIGHMAKECSDMLGKNDQTGSDMEFGGWLRFQGPRSMRRQGSPSKNAYKEEGNDGKQKGGTDNHNGEDMDEEVGLDQMETIDPLLSNRGDVQIEIGKDKKGKGKLVDLNEASATEMDNENTEMNLLLCVDKLAHEDSPCRSLTDGLSREIEVSARKKTHWKRRTRMSQVSDPSSIQITRGEHSKKRKNGDDMTTGGKRARSEGNDVMEMGEDLNFSAEAVKRPCREL